MSLQSFTDAYIECALWSSNDESRDDGGDPLDDNYSASDLAPETRARMEADCKAFYDAHAATWANAYRVERADPVDAQAGHDFWLTRNGHGAGFWDGDWSEPAATALTSAAKACGEYNLNVDDNGQIWGSPC